MPNILIVVLSRFSYDLKQKIKRKVCDRVAIDNWLVFGNLTSSQKQDNYKLVAFINHMGSNAESGHYQTHVRHPFVEDKWLNFDDEFVTESVYTKAKDLIENFK
jgi:ubiquitin C-terminal hydrolase